MEREKSQRGKEEEKRKIPLPLLKGSHQNGKGYNPKKPPQRKISHPKFVNEGW
jgi:hypothetical protein